ncbi:hypothetical protein ACFLQL_00005 [Verrucomicrobiota bacterium]
MSYIRICETVLNTPLLETNKANFIEFFGDDGKLNALLYKHFNNDTWVLVTKSDPDWATTLIRLGYVTVDTTPREFLNNIKK